MMTEMIIERIEMTTEEFDEFVIRRIREELKRKKVKMIDILRKHNRSWGWIQRKFKRTRRLTIQDIELFANEIGVPPYAFFMEADEWYIQEASLPKLVQYIARNAVKEEIKLSRENIKDKEEK